MEGVRGREPARGHVAFGQAHLEPFDRGRLPRDDRQVGRVLGSNFEVAGQELAHIVARRPDRQHCSFGQGLHEPGAFGHDPQRVISREHTSETRGHVLAHGVADHAFGLDPEPAPRHREGVLDYEQGGLGYSRLAEPLLRQLFAARLGIEDVA